jgi:tRNA nucleotidyltransferase (CCA-adding enzyme)
MQLCARFELEPAPQTLALCRSLSPAGLPAERIFGEWRKLLLRGQRISRGLAFLRASDWLRHYPELAALPGCPQDPEWHPEGDVWVHTLHCLDAFAAARSGDEREDLLVGLAVLCHDLGKPATTRREPDGRITSRRHERVGEELTRRLLERMTREAVLLREVPRLVAAHLAPMQLHRSRAGDAAVRRLARRVGSIERLLRVASADFAGRPPKPAAPFEAGDWLRARARALAVAESAPAPLLRGRDLLALGLAPGPHIGRILDACFEAQLAGRVTSHARALALAQQLAREMGAPRC